ncbi:MAG: N-methyl-L-tryptophan oxidase [Streptosporangiales bacterium]
MTFDVIVVGLGGMGSAAAQRLAGRGLRVLGLERFGPAHDLGSSHGRSRVTRQAYAEHPSYVPLMRRAYELWREVERESGRSLLTLTGGIMIGAPDSAVVSGARRSAEQWGLPHEVLDAAEVRRRFATLTPADGELAVYEPACGFVRPEESVLAHGELASSAGAELHHHEPVRDWSESAESVRVTTDRATYTADRVVFCAGPWSSALLPDLDVPMVVERQVMHWFEPRGDVAPFHPDRHPVYLWEVDADSLFYGFPAQDGESCVKVAFYHRPGVTDPDEVDRQVSAAEVDEIADHLAERVPSLAGRHLVSKTCMYTLTPDHDFVLGVHPEHPRAVVAAGFSGHGFKFVPLVGEVLADLVVDGRTRHDIALFDPTRAVRTG